MFCFLDKIQIFLFSEANRISCEMYVLVISALCGYHGDIM